MDTLVALMDQGLGRIHTDRYHSVLRPWNIFNECDVDGSATLDEKEMEILLWIFFGKKPDLGFLKMFVEHIDLDRSGFINREEWVLAIIEGHGGFRTFNDSSIESY